MTPPKLGEYNRKRDPKQTPEPFTSKQKRSKAPIFVVQRHDARRLHYDFRLERNGALASWAVPKGVPLETGQRALAVHVEDHPLDYATFAGEIPKGNYGAGTVEIWDHGTYDLVEEKPDGGLTVRLHGERLDGTWTLVPAHLDGKEQNWLLMRKRDETVRSDARNDYKAMLATLASELPTGSDWLFEVKWDGFRALGYVRGGEARLVSRNGNDLTARFPEIAKSLAKAARSPTCVVDGEVCALDEKGRPSFSAMQQGKPGTPIVYEVFDALEINGEPIVDLPLEERRERLEALLDKRVQNVQVSGFFDDGGALFEAALEQGLEGVMAKRRGSRYAEGKRNRDWLKVKTHGRQEFVVCGWTKGQGRRAGSFGSLVLGTYRGKEVVWVGNVGTGFTEHDIAELLAKLEPLRTDTAPFKEIPKMPKVRKGDVVWVKPVLVAEVEFAEWTHDGHLRAPCSRGCATTSRLATCGVRTRSRRRLAASSSRISTRSSSPRRGSRRATSSTTTARSHRCSFGTCATGRSRCAAIRTGSRARRSSRRTRRCTCRSGSRASACRSRPASRRGSASGSRRRS